MTSSLPFDILTQIVVHADHNVLLNLRTLCSDARDFITPLAFQVLRVRCTAQGFQRLDALGMNSQSLCALVLDLSIVQSDEDLEQSLSQGKRDSVASE